MNFKILDIFSIPIHLNFKGSISHGSFIGLFFTASLVAVLAFLSFIVSQDLWLRQTPQLSQAQYYSQSKIYLKDIPITTAIFNNQYTPYPLDVLSSYVYFQASIQSIDSKGQSKNVQRNFVNCITKLNQFSPESLKIIQNIELQNYYCLDFEQDDYIIGDYATLESQFLHIQIYYCVESESQSCKSIQETQSFLSDYNVYFYIANSNSVNGNNYLSPLSITPYALLYQGSYLLQKSNIISLGTVQVKSDDGLILPNWTTYTGVEVVQKQNDFNEFPTTGNNKNVMSSIILAGSNQATLTTRTYLKIGDVLAKIFGYLGALRGTLMIFLSVYQNWSLKLNFYKSLKQVGFEIQVSKSGQINLFPSKKSIIEQQMEMNEVKFQNNKLKWLQEQQEFQFFKIVYFKIIKFIFKKRNKELEEFIQIEKFVVKLLSLEGIFTTILHLKMNQELQYQLSEQSQINQSDDYNKIMSSKLDLIKVQPLVIEKQE